MKRKINILLILIVICFSACNDWLDVSPKETKKASELFNSQEGFKKALTGIYIELGSKELYGENLTLSVLDVLAQNYSTPNDIDRHRYKYYSDYNYEVESVKKTFDKIYSKSYNLIANCNGILDIIDSKESLFTGNNYAMIKAEALALRAFLHFDLFRMFAPQILSEADYDKEALNYRIHISPKVNENKKAGEYLQYVIRDLKEARDSLVKNDPILEYSPKSVNFEERRTKMNYYAVQGLLARVYLYAGLKNKAYKAAKELTQYMELFPVTSIDEYQPSEKKSLTFANEHLFSMYVNHFGEDYMEELFLKDNSDATVLAFKTADIKNGYEENAGHPDLRYSTWFEIGLSDYSKFIKYNQGDVIPMIKISEILLILAETAPTMQEATAYYNILINPRGIPSETLDNFNKDIMIEKEYYKDMVGEGQMFFYFKRKNKKYLPNGKTVEDPNKVYVFPQPLNESEFKK